MVMIKTNIPIATCKDNLLFILSTFDISVPPLGLKRTKNHVERWSICKLLSTLAYQNKLFYPLQLIHDDRPDFLIKFSDQEVGVEITAARNENHAHYQAILNREYPEKIYSPSLFRPGEETLSTTEIHEDLKQDTLSGIPLMGNKPEKDWAEYIQIAIEAKLVTLAKVEFKKFDKNWLLIYVAIPFTNIDLDVALSYLNPHLPKIWAEEVTFDAIYVEHIHYIIQLSPTKSALMEIKEIW